jgi:hypothetical protein
LSFTCRWCGVTFIGPGAVQRWSDHTWEHAHELPLFAEIAGCLRSGTTHENARSQPE